jgi:hypothetical protein
MVHGFVVISYKFARYGIFFHFWFSESPFCPASEYVSPKCFSYNCDCSSINLLQDNYLCSLKYDFVCFFFNFLIYAPWTGINLVASIGMDLHLFDSLASWIRKSLSLTLSKWILEFIRAATKTLPSPYTEVLVPLWLLPGQCVECQIKIKPMKYASISFCSLQSSAESEWNFVS